MFFNLFKKKEIKKMGLLNEEHYNNKWPKAPIIYSGRALRGKKDRINVDVKNFISTNDEILNEIVKKYKLQKSNPDDTAWEVQKWVVKFLTYKYDDDLNQTPEFWQFPFETLQSQHGDCEDGAILITSLCVAAGVPTWRTKVAAGYVQASPTAPQGGHAYNIYLASDGDWRVCDWCIVDNKRTLIQTPNGSKRISKLKDGDWVIGYDEENQKPALTQIKKLGNRYATNIFKIEFENGDPLYATGEHPFYVKGKWKKTDELVVGDEPYYIKPGVLYHMLHDHRSDLWRKIAHIKTTQTLKENGTYEKLSIRQKLNNIWTREDVRKKLSENNCMKRPEIVEKNYGNRENNHVSGAEKKFIEYCKYNNLPVDFFGNAKFWIRTKLGSKNPDFKVKDENKLIEVSCEWMNNLRNWEEYKKERKEIFEEKGFKTLFVLYDNHYNNIIEPNDIKEINQFIMNGNKIKKITPINAMNSSKYKNGTTVWNMHCEPFNNYFVNGNLVHNCYYEDSKTPILKKPLAKNGGYNNCYKDVWFTFNNQYSWNQSSLTVGGRISNEEETKTLNEVLLEKVSVDSIIEKIDKKINE